MCMRSQQQWPLWPFLLRSHTTGRKSHNKFCLEVWASFNPANLRTLPNHSVLEGVNQGTQRSCPPSLHWENKWWDPEYVLSGAGRLRTYFYLSIMWAVTDYRSSARCSYANISTSNYECVQILPRMLDFWASHLCGWFQRLVLCQGFQSAYSHKMIYNLHIPRSLSGRAKAWSGPYLTQFGHRTRIRYSGGWL